LQSSNHTAVTDFQSLAVRWIYESEAYRQPHQVSNLGRGANRNPDEVQVVAFGSPGTAFN